MHSREPAAATAACFDSGEARKALCAASTGPGSPSPHFACFPGGGAKYGAHYDGGGFANNCKLTTVLYTNPGWDAAAHGGALVLLDERSG